MGLLSFSPFPPLFLRSLVTRNNIYSKKWKRFLLTMSKVWSSESFQNLKYSVTIVINWMTNIYVDFPTLKGSESRVILLKFTKVCVIYPTENNPLPLLSSPLYSFKIQWITILQKTPRKWKFPSSYPLLFLLSKSNKSLTFPVFPKEDATFDIT